MPYLGYALAYINHTQTVPRVCFGIGNPSQPTPGVQFGYDLHTPTHTLGNINIGFGFCNMFTTQDVTLDIPICLLTTMETKCQQSNYEGAAWVV